MSTSDCLIGVVLASVLAFTATGCSGGGGGGGPPAATPPVISHLTYSPTVARVGSGTVSVTGTIEFSDSGGNLASVTLRVLDPSGKQLSAVTTPVQGMSGQTSGTITGTFQVATGAAGIYMIQVSASDSAGATSNVLNGTFQIVAVSSQASVVAQTEPGLSSLVAAEGTLYWSETGQDAIRSVPKAGGAIETVANRVLSPFSLGFNGSDVIWLDGGAASPVCSMRVLKRTTTNNATTIIASGSACAGGGALTDPGIVVIGTTVYWLTSTASPDTYVINATPVTGGQTLTVAMGNAPVVGMIGYGGTLYWMDTLIRSYPGSGAPATVAGGLSSSTFAVDGTSVYYTAGSPPSIMDQPLAGGPAVAVASTGGSVGKLVVAAGTLVWSEPESLRAVSTAGGAVSTLATFALGRLRDFAFDGTNVFWSETNDGATGVIHSVPVSGGAVSDIYQGAVANRFALDNSLMLNWVESGAADGCARVARLNSSGSTQSAQTVIAGIASTSPIITTAAGNLLIADLSCIKTIPLTGGMPALFSAGSTIASLTGSSDGKSVFWVNSSGSVDRLQLADGSITAVSGPGSITGAPPAPGNIQLSPDGASLYWVADPQTVLSVSSSASSAAPTAVAEGLNGVSGLAVDSHNVYISDQTGILKAPRTGGGTPTQLLTGSTTEGARQLTLDGATLYWLSPGMVAKVNTDGTSPAEVIEFDSEGGSGSSAPAFPMSYALDSSTVYFTEPWAADIRSTPK